MCDQLDVAAELAARLVEGVRIAVIGRGQTARAIGELEEPGDDVERRHMAMPRTT